MDDDEPTEVEMQDVDAIEEEQKMYGEGKFSRCASQIMH